MDRRAFVKALGAIAATIKAAGLVDMHPDPIVPAGQVHVEGYKGLDKIASGWVGNGSDELYMLPTADVVELELSRHVRKISYCGDYVDDVIMSAPEVHIKYVTDEPLPELTHEMCGDTKCRLEAHGMRVDGYIVSVTINAEFYSGRRFVTEVVMRSTGAIEVLP